VKARFIYEALDFERGADPRDSMELGRLGKRAMDRMEPGVIYVSSTPRWGYYWFYKDPRDNKIYKAFSLKREGGYKVDEWGNNLYNEETDFPLDLQPTGKHFDKFLAKIVQVNRIRESLNFERGGDPKDSIRVGRKWKWDMTAEELSIHIINDIREKSKPIINKITQFAKKAGFKSLEEYNEYILDQYDKDPSASPEKVRHVSKEINDAEKELDKLIKEEVEKYPFKSGINNKGTVIGSLFSLMLEGGAFMTYVDIIKGYLDKEYLKESSHFLRGAEPKSSMNVGMAAKYGPSTALFLQIHEFAKHSKSFSEVGDIDFSGKEPKFFIVSKRENASGKPKKEYPFEEFLFYLTPDEGIICFADHSESNEEYTIADLDYFKELTI